jgi:hypothetical protein
MSDMILLLVPINAPSQGQILFSPKLEAEIGKYNQGINALLRSYKKFQETEKNKEKEMEQAP